MTIASILAEDQIERLNGFTFSAPALDVCGTAFCHEDAGGGAAGTGTNLNDEGEAQATGRFRREWDVSTITTGVKRITVRVRWTDIPGGATTPPAGSFNRSLQYNSSKFDPS